MHENFYNRSVKFLLYGHGGYNNRGCEAIVRSTVSLIRTGFPNASIRIASYRYEDDIKSRIEGIDGYVPHEAAITKYSIEWLKCVYFKKLKRDNNSSYKVLQRKAIHEAANSDICMSIGGDNYCYGEPVQFYAIDRAIKKLGKKMILWGASIEPGSINKKMIEDLKQFDALFTRESITYKKLKQLNISKNIFLYPDPAFTMEKEVTSLPDGWIKEKMIGINLSPLVMNYERKKGVVMASFFKLIEYIMSNTDFQIILIPHVVSKNNNDYEVLKVLYEQFKNEGRILLLGTDYTAPQLKYLISRCRLFIGARTHATIAAYSTCVPTLVIGYSVKARGIARDIFGDEKDYVLPVQSLTNFGQLLNGFKFLLEKEVKIRKHLQKVMPQYIKKARNAVVKLEEFAGLEKQEVLNL